MSLQKLKQVEDKLPTRIEAAGVRLRVPVLVESSVDWSGLGLDCGFAEAEFVSQRFIEDGVGRLRWVFEG
ncbi:hypothetical protein EHW61_16615, partial [Salinivibrio sp. VYel6]|uniref:hypothetical protein n=1 Tax=Salinivibrio sp. VYel6 TaxID=2490493 RepID=UPI00128D6285